MFERVEEGGNVGKGGGRGNVGKGGGRGNVGKGGGRGYLKVWRKGISERVEEGDI